MTQEQAKQKAIECEQLNGRPFSVTFVQYCANSEWGWDVTPSEYVEVNSCEF